MTGTGGPRATRDGPAPTRGGFLRAALGTGLLWLPALVAAGCGDGGAGEPDAPADALDAIEGDADPHDVTGDTDDGGTEACDACHGAGGRPEPPPALDGATETSARGVGAHAAHLAPSPRHADVRCVHCHPVPDSVAAPGHLDDTRPADVVFSGLAAIGLDAGWDGTTCAVYCHGGAFRFAPRRSGEWTSGTVAGCTSCHGRPPGAPHPPASDCGRCHLGVADESGAIVRGLLHVDSIVAAPHGAHLVHLGGAGGPELECTTCHPDGGVHGPLRDGEPLESTTICDPCHAPAPLDPAAWRDYHP